MGKCQFVGVRCPGKLRKNAGSYVCPSWPISSNCLRVIEITINLREVDGWFGNSCVGSKRADIGAPLGRATHSTDNHFCDTMPPIPWGYTCFPATANNPRAVGALPP